MKKTAYTLALLALSLGAAAQNLNPTVEVTNTYKREASGIEKPDQLLPLPDSVSRFNYDFDYTVRSTPYRGSYEFKPYNVQLRPNARPETQSTLFAKIGAGYGFHRSSGGRDLRTPFTEADRAPDNRRCPDFDSVNS